MSSHKFRPSENVLSEYSATSVDPMVSERPLAPSQPLTRPLTQTQPHLHQGIVYDSDKYDSDMFNPFRMSRRFDQLLSNFERSFFRDPSYFLSDSLSGRNNFNIHEDNTSYTYEIEIPGIPKEDIVVEEKSGYVSVSGKKSLKKEDKKEGYRYIGTSYGSFSRTFKVPKNGDVNQITAKYDSGVLSLVVPKIPDITANQKRITVF